MTFELDTDATARRSAADTVAREVVTPAAPAADAAAAVPAAVRGAIRAIVPPSPAAASLDWVVALEALAVVSPTVAIVAAGEALGAPSVTTTAQWTGLRGADVDGLRGALADDASWHLAVTATLVGAGRAAVEAAVAALKRRARRASRRRGSRSRPMPRRPWRRRGCCCGTPRISRSRPRRRG